MYHHGTNITHPNATQLHTFWLYPEGVLCKSKEQETNPYGVAHNPWDTMIPVYNYCNNHVYVKTFSINGWTCTRCAKENDEDSGICGACDSTNPRWTRIADGYVVRDSGYQRFPKCQVKQYVCAGHTNISEMAVARADWNNRGLESFLLTTTPFPKGWNPIRGRLEIEREEAVIKGDVARVEKLSEAIEKLFQYSTGQYRS